MRAADDQHAKSARRTRRDSRAVAVRGAQCVRSTSPLSCLDVVIVSAILSALAMTVASRSCSLRRPAPPVWRVLMSPSHAAADQPPVAAIIEFCPRRAAGRDADPVTGDASEEALH